MLTYDCKDIFINDIDLECLGREIDYWDLFRIYGTKVAFCRDPESQVVRMPLEVLPGTILPRRR